MVGALHEAVGLGDVEFGIGGLAATGEDVVDLRVLLGERVDLGGAGGELVFLAFSEERRS